MSNKVKKIAKTLGHLTFPTNMYSNQFGSWIIANYLLQGCGTGKDVNRICKTWKKLEKSPESFIDLSDKDYLKKLCESFGVKCDLSGSIAMVVGRNNIVHLICDENGTLLPLREDGLYPLRSLSDALEDETIYRVVEDKVVPLENAKVEGE